MKYFTYLFCLIAILSCVEEGQEDIRPLIPGVYEGEMEYWGYNETTEDFDLNAESLHVSAAVTQARLDSEVYKIEFSKTPPIDIPTFSFKIESLYGTYGSIVNVGVLYSGGDPCPFYFSYVTNKRSPGIINKGDSDKINLRITYYSCSEPEDSFRIQFTGVQDIN